ncbi:MULTISPECIES: KilA-N domain-containing protein [unclassified Mannheimia]|uniref:KilA-N domain-containing protein n=1 Tax=unclassified Mannheimia TaxID=2645054 RepID=UPI00359D648E
MPLLSPQKWISTTNVIGIVSKSGRYGGTFAHSDIALEFASWISAEFKLYIIQDYKRLKSDKASLNELLILANMESYNAVLIEKAIPQAERMIELCHLARSQFLALENLNLSQLMKAE